MYSIIFMLLNFLCIQKSCVKLDTPALLAFNVCKGNAVFGVLTLDDLCALLIISKLSWMYVYACTID